ncbi:MAG: glycosyltransferase family 39 protein [Acidobacteriota bacterium]
MLARARRFPAWDRLSSAEGRLLLILIAALLLRLALPAVVWFTVGRPEVFVAPDTAGYLTPATGLVSSGRLAGPGGPELFRPPGFPSLLAIGLLFGVPITVTLGLQALIGTLTVYLVWRSALLVSDDSRAAAWAALACAVEPQLLLFSAMVLSETLAAAAVAVAVWLLLRHLAQPSYGRAAAAGVATAAVAYVRAIAYFLPFCCSLLLACMSLLDRERRRALRHAFVFLVVAAATLAAWHVRNGLVAGYWGFSTHLDRALYVLVGGSVRAGQEGVSYGVARKRQLKDLGALDVPGATLPPETFRVMRRRGLEALGAAPVAFLKSYLRGIPVTLLDPGVPGVWRLFGRPPLGLWSAAAEGGLGAALRRLGSLPPSVPLIAAGLGALSLAYLLLAGLGLARGLRSNPRAALLLAGLAVYFVALSGGPHALARFRVPIMPIVAVLAGIGMARLTSRALERPGLLPVSSGSDEERATNEREGPRA